MHLAFAAGPACRTWVFRRAIRDSEAAVRQESRRGAAPGAGWWSARGLRRRGPLLDPARDAATCRASGQAEGTPALIEWDVVLYSPTNSCTAVGRVSQLQAEAATIERLEEEGEGLWAVTAEVDVVPLSSVQQVLPADYMQLMDTDRVSNPHGEHAHEAFKITVPVPPGLWGARGQTE